MANMMAGEGTIQTITEIAEAHAGKIKTIKLETDSPNVSISYTDIGDIHMGADVTNTGYAYSGNVEVDIQNYAGDIVDLSNKKAADDQSDASNFN